MVNFPKAAATKDITVRAYVKDGEIYKYSDNVVTRNLSEIAVVEYEKGNDGAFVTAVYDASETTFNLNGGTFTTSNYSMSDYNHFYDANGVMLHGKGRCTASTSAAWTGYYDRIFLKYNAEKDFYYVVATNATGWTYSNYDSQDYDLVLMNSENAINTDFVANLANNENVNDLIFKIESDVELDYTSATKNIPANITINVYENEKIYNISLTGKSHLGGSADLPTPSKDYYDFAGWCNDENLTNSPVTKQGKDRTLYAKYTPTNYTISYEVDEGSWIDGYTPVSSYNYESDEIVLPTAENISREGYLFTGWVDSKGNEITKVEKGSSGNLEITAVWQKLTTTTVTYNLNNGSFLFDYEFVIQNFNDYNNGLSTGTTTAIVPISQAGKRLNYTWKRIVIEFDAELGLWYSVGVGSTTTSADITGSENAYVIGSHKSNTDTGSKAKIDEIFTSVSKGEVYYFDLGSFTLNNKPSASGSWNQKVKVDKDYKLLLSNKIEYFSSSLELPQAQKTGYTFNGWYDNSEFTGDVINSVTVGNENIEMNLYAKYTPITYTITYNLDGGTCSVATVTNYTIESSTIVLPSTAEMTMQGATFAGWVDANNNEITEIVTGSSGNIELTAQWLLDKVSELEIANEDANALNALYDNEQSVATIIVNSQITSASKYVLSNVNLNNEYNEIEFIYGENLFSSVGDAIAAAKGNDFIYVFKGTYTGDLTISVANISLIGPNYNIDYKSNRNNEATISGMINVDAAGFTLNGFTYTGSAKAIKVTTATSNLTIKNNLITATGTSTSGGRTGIIASDVAINGFTFVNNNLTCTGSAGKNAFALYDTVTNCNITNNKINNGAGSGAKSYSEIIRAPYIAGTFNFDNNDCLWGTQNYSIMVGWSGNTCTSISISNNTIQGSTTATTTTICVRYIKANVTFNFNNNTFENFDSGSTLDFRYANAASTINIKNNVFGSKVNLEIIYIGSGTVNWENNTYNGGISSENKVQPGDYSK